MHNQLIGKLGEDIAQNYLERKGYRVIQKNVRVGYKEIDIISKKEKNYYFIEVKTRYNKIFGYAEDALSAKKLKRIKQGIKHYCIINKINFEQVFVDFIAINLDIVTKKANIKHFKNII
jgi:putative endonuclease